MTLLRRVVALLADQGIRHALIGAAALAAHGVSRSTLDQDLLVTDRRALEPDLWDDLSGDTVVEARPGGADDPLAGVVRLSETGQRDVDVVVGRSPWQEGILARALPGGGGDAPLVEAADLILLKLYAGGSQDRWDIEQLMAVQPGLAPVVEARLAGLPAWCWEMWRSLV